ncbi:hypothetical protein C1T31_09215 [Hanstruepera neustonica]|uniref:Uncharacterized protein n=2 Tax=Hanstruepera neustonica TaxID=1445657 RepID=A0A2K1DYR8_9FLAO|nr:hypothetical protein C1T31_09215 [Hanstruepera neustonica]
MGLTTVTATEIRSGIQDEDLMTRYRYAQPVMFVERGVEFMIFPDGSFDFNTNVVTDFHTSNNYYYRSATTTTRRSSINITFGAPGVTNRVHFSTPRDRGVIIQHDRDGKVRRIGNVFINYDRFGKVKRVGSIYMQYNRGNNRLIQVGGLHVRYNVFGELVHSHGQVSPFSNSCGICGISGCTTAHTFGNSTFDHDSDWNDDEDFYYYKEDKKDNKLQLKR